MTEPNNICPFCGRTTIMNEFSGRGNTITRATFTCYHCHTEMTISTERWWDLPRLDDNLDAIEHWSRRPK